MLRKCGRHERATVIAVRHQKLVADLEEARAEQEVTLSMLPATWSGWVQERGLYFLGEKDSRYRELIAINEPFPYNQGEKQGALVVGNYGRGRWVYVGLGLWRELPAGVDGAYQLLANLISLKGS